MEDAFKRLADDAIQAGWPAGIVHDALVSLAENGRLAYREDPDPAGQ